MLDRKEITEWTIRKYGVKIRRVIKTLTRDIADSEGRKNVMNRFRDIEMEDVPGALYETWTEVKGSKYVVYYKQNRARKKFLKGFLKGGHRFIKFIALLMVFWVLFITGPDRTFGVSVFAFLFIIWFLEDILLMFLSFRKSKKNYLEGLDPPEEPASGKNGRLNFTYVFGTALFLFSILSILFLIPPLSTPWDIKTTHGKYSWAIIYIFVIILWLVATNAMVSAFKHSHSLGRRLALLSHDKRIMKRLNREEHLNKYGRALTKYVYLPVLLSAVFVGVSMGFKYVYAILMEGLKSENFSVMDSLGTGMMNLISGEKTAELPEWLPRINGVWLLLFQLVCLILICVGTYMRNRKINSVLWPNTPQSPSGKKVSMLVEDLEFIKEKGDGDGDDDGGKGEKEGNGKEREGREGEGEVTGDEDDDRGMREKEGNGKEREEREGEGEVTGEGDDDGRIGEKEGNGEEREEREGEGEMVGNGMDELNDLQNPIQDEGTMGLESHDWNDEEAKFHII